MDQSTMVVDAAAASASHGQHHGHIGHDGPPGPAGPSTTAPRRRRLRWRINDLSVGRRLTLHSLLVMGVPLAVAVFVGLSTATDLIGDAEDRELQRVATALESDIDATALRASTLAAGVAAMPTIAEAFAARDREALAAEVVPSFEQIEQEHGLAQLQFHEPPATSFLRAHEPEQHGDDLSGFRATVVTANAERAPVTGLETGRFGLGLRAVVPVRWEGEHVGTVEVGTSLGSAYFERFAANNDVDVAFFLPEGDEAQGGPAFTTYASTVGEQLPVDGDALGEVLDGEPLVTGVDAADASLAARFDQVLGFSDEPIGVVMVAVSDEVAQSTLRGAAWQYAALAIVLLAAGGTASWLLAREFARPIEKVRGVLQRARDGDLSGRVDVNRGDEIGAVGSDINETLERLAELMRDVDHHAQTLASAADEMSAVSDQLEMNAAATADRAATASVAARDVSGNVDSIASASQQMTVAINEIAGRASEASGVAERGVAVTDETVASMQALGQSSEEIETVLTVITEIAGQTHLLALNANIEAARAGESGRAFAVVADEIGSLARRTAAESETIADRIRDIRQRTTGSIDGMSAVSETIHEISTLQAAIASAVEEQSATTGEIGRSVGEAATTSASIAESVEAVSQGTDETRQAAGDSSSAAAELRTVAAGLRSSIAYYVDS